MRTTILTALVVATIITACDRIKDRPEINYAEYPLPGNSFYPEGIAYDWVTGKFFTGSSSNGDILMVDVETAKVRLFADGKSAGRAAATGMKLDKFRRLWVCGGADNKINVLSPLGETIKQWDTKALFNSGFVNDCITDGKSVYFTDSYVQKIYRIDVTNLVPDNPDVWLSFTNNELPYEAGQFNLNGIEATPDNQYLIVVNSFSGKLYRIDKSTKEIVEIKLNTTVTYGDGLYLDGNILYVSRNALGQIFPVALNDDYTTGQVGNPFGSNLLYNTTITKAGNYFLVVNGQLNNTKPNLPFTVSRERIPE